MSRVLFIYSLITYQTMSKTTHTPGPWDLVPIDTKHGESLAVESANGTLITYDLPNVHGHPELMANAKLLAAAPEMLEALQGFHPTLCKTKGDLTRAWETAKATIAKATQPTT
jgi:hypothetical protein